MNENLKRQYSGYSSTSKLWKGTLSGLKQFDFDRDNGNSFAGSIEKKLRLGHVVEHFVESELLSDSSIEILGKNIQIYSDKRTIGEYDFIIEKAGVQYHIEVVYKFYVFDETVGNSDLESWIGPNRKDSLIQKMDKIKEKQFPLIQRPESIGSLALLGVNSAKVEQRVYFKAKLFIPYGKEVAVEPLNQDCVAGFYVSFKDLDQFKGAQFFIPTKHDWLVEAHSGVEWLNYETGKSEIETLIEEKRSLLVWMKREDRVETFFVVWW
ncbi:MAG: DUF1853 family protein [Crocinitomicaceae bacterium]|nr:DUF1853 family protein [Crocinitomicaceae bacterium]